MPSLRYDDVGRALTWLRDAFGLIEYLRWSLPDMRISACWTTPSPQSLGRVSSALVVLVDDVDEHHERAVTAGARVLAPLEDEPWRLRQYTALDQEGHRWEFSQQVRRVAPNEWSAEIASQLPR